MKNYTYKDSFLRSFSSLNLGSPHSFRSQRYATMKTYLENNKRTVTRASSTPIQLSQGFGLGESRKTLKLVTHGNDKVDVVIIDKDDANNADGDLDILDDEHNF